MKSLTDEELLTYLNDWEDEHRDRNDDFIAITISALAGEFQSLFKGKIITDDSRRDFWLMNRSKIDRPIYISAMLKAMSDVVSEKKLENINHWIKFCKWILSHPATVYRQEEPKPQEESRDYPDWSRTRRAVLDFIEVCIDKKTETPVAARRGLASLLEQVCCQSDWWLDYNHTVLPTRDFITEAINNTRSRALETFVLFGFWVRRQMPEEQVSEVTDTLTKRICKDAEFPLTLSERALLGKLFGNIYILDRDWAVQQREKIFPQECEPVWREAFGSYLRFNRPSTKVFEALRGQFKYALENLKILVTDNNNELIDILGQHIFIYYFWGLYPLIGDDSLLEYFYEKNSDEPEHWRRLFAFVGQLLRNHDRVLDSTLSERITTFFDWRFNTSESSELQEFTFWLDAKCLDPDWRLKSYSKILTFCRGQSIGFSITIRNLNELLQTHPALVVECFAKFTDTFDQSKLVYISVNDASPILQVGLTSKDHQIRENAKRAQDNLLKHGRSDYLEI